MSFSSNIKEEIALSLPKARHCMLAELSVMFTGFGKIKKDEVLGTYAVFGADNILLAKKCFTLIKKTFNIVPDISAKTAMNRDKKAGSRASYEVRIFGEKNVMSFLLGLKLLGEKEGEGAGNIESYKSLLSRSCCKRSFLRGAFLSSGSVADPNKEYHLEITMQDPEMAEVIKNCILAFDIEAKITKRLKNYVVYIKESEGIVDFLNVIEAHGALMEMENVRIIRGMRGSINRQVNCETANINKTITASMKQIEDINLIKEEIGFGALSEQLRDMCEVRLANPDTPLGELGELLKVPIGKSGVNHRLRKISELADEIREKR